MLTSIYTGIRIIESHLLTKTTTRTKRWKRSGDRAAKVRVRSWTSPSPDMYIVRLPPPTWLWAGWPPSATGDPAPEPMIVGHPATIAALRAEIDSVR